MDKKEIKPVSQFEIVNKVAAMLNLGDFGKIENFVTKTANTLAREVETAERSKKNELHNLDTKLAALNEELEDAQLSVEEAYSNLDPANLKTNEAQRSFMETYLEALDKAEAVVLGIQENIKRAKEASEKVIENLDKQIAVRQTRINRLTKGVK